MTRLRSLLLGLCLAAPALATPQPFRAEYEVLVDGRPAGEAVMELRRSEDGVWQLRLDATATRGLARLAGVQSAHSARLDLAEDVPRLLAAQATLHSRVRDRALRLEIDWERNEVRWSGDLDRDAPARQPLAGTPATGTSLNLMLALAARRLAPGEEVRYALLERGRQRGVAYRAGHREAVEVPAGRFEAVPMQRQGDARRRTTTAWFDPHLPPAPVRMLQSESGQARYELRLLRIEPLQAPADAS